MSKYFWCEDTGAGYRFWKEISDVIDPEIKVESKRNNTGLRKAIEHITDNNNDYYVFIDMAIDNQDVLREITRVNKIAASKDNVHVVNIHSFEFVLLSFELLEKWVFAEQDELREARKDLLSARDLLLKMVSEVIDQEEYSRIFDLTGYNKSKNSEQIAASLLKSITRNTGFETNKRKLGECFINDCCKWADRSDNDKCGLDYSRLQSYEKKALLIRHSALQKSFKEVGLI